MKNTKVILLLLVLTLSWVPAYAADKRCEPALNRTDGGSYRFGKVGQIESLDASELSDEQHSAIYTQAFLFFRHHLRPPTVHELAEVIGFEDEHQLGEIVRTPGFWDDAIASDLGRHLDYARKRVATAYARAVRGTDTPAVHRTRRVPPTTRRVAQILAMTRSNERYQWRVAMGDFGKYDLTNPKSGKFNQTAAEAMLARLTQELEGLLGMTEVHSPSALPEEQWVFKLPVLFPGGMQELYTASRADYQSSFTSYKNISRFSIQHAEAIRDKIAEAPGFLISGFKPGRGIDWAQLAGMKRFAKDKGYVLILIPEDGMWQDIDSRLLDDSKINILPYGIENNELLISVHPSNDRGDPFRPFKKPGAFKIGQQIIFPHATLAHESIPTAHNTQNQTQLYSTGTINVPKIGAVGGHQEAKAYQTSNEMKQAFLVVEKIDKGKDATFGGSGNSWHVRPVEVKPARLSQVDGKEEPTVFVENAIAYRVSPGPKDNLKVKVGKSPVTTIYFSDAHMIFADPKILIALQEYLERVCSPDTPFQIVIPDPIDNFWVNAHIQKKQMDIQLIRRMIQNGQIFGEQEINDLNGNINALLEKFSNASAELQNSNHTEWLRRHLINNPSDLQLFANGDLRDEINFALKHHPTWTPFEYLLIHRKRFLKAVALDGSDRWQAGHVFITDPSRVRVMHAGEPLTTEATYEGLEFALQHHGDKGANGGRSSFKVHQMGETRQITGDAHRMGYYGRGNNFWIGVGSLYPFFAEYTKEGYSSWGVGVGVVFADGTGTLAQYDPNSESFVQRPEIGVLPAREFFGDHPLQVVPPMDDDQGRIDLDEQEWLTWLEQKVRWLR